MRATILAAVTVAFYALVHAFSPIRLGTSGWVTLGAAAALALTSDALRRRTQRPRAARRQSVRSTTTGAWSEGAPVP